MRPIDRLTFPVLTLVTLLGASCGGGDDVSPADLFPDKMTIVVSGLTDTVTVNLDATTDATFTITADGTYLLDHSFAADDTFTLTATPAGSQACTFDTASGTISDDITIHLLCSSTAFAVTGTISGLRTGSSITVTLNNATVATLTTNGAVTFASAIASGSNVTIAASGTGYVCTTTNGTATALAADKTDVQISCQQITQLYSAGTHTGGLGGRSGADSMCSTAASSSGNCSAVHAFLGVSASDEIRDFPTNYSLRTDRALYYGSTKIADDWTDLLDGSIDSALGINWWSGSDASGGLDSHNCTGWTNGSISNDTGERGNGVFADGSWIAFQDIACYADDANAVLCLCQQNDYQLGGTAIGLNGGTLVVALNGSEQVTVTADAAFYFSTSLASGASYAVTVVTNPTGRVCSVTNGNGTIGTGTTAVTVTCIDVNDQDSDGIADAGESAYGLIPYVTPQGSINLTSSNVALYRGSSTSFRTPTGIAVSTVGLSSGTTNTDLDGDDSSDSAEITAGTNLFVAASTGTLSTSSTVTLAASTLMMDSIVADFSGDGVLDLASVGIGASSVGVVAIGNGSGGFGTASSFTVGSEPAALAAADFDEDGDMDLVIANSATDNVSVILNSGTGSLSSLTNYSVGDYPYDIAVGDWNGDGHIDIAVANRGPSTDNTTLSILLGAGNGTLGAATSVTTNAGPSFLTTGDFDNDGDLDLAVTHRGFNGTGNTFSVFTNNGSGTFGGKTDYTTEAAPGGVTTGDFDSDGDLDIAIANTGAMDDGNTLSVFLNASGVFGTRTNYSIGTGPVGIVTFDVDGDNDLDLLAANTAATGGSTLALLKGDDTGAFAAATAVSVGSAPVQMAPGDFDRDGDIDVLVTNFAGGNASVVLNQ